MVIEDIMRISIPGISSGRAHYFAECAVSCLSWNKHKSGTTIFYQGDVEGTDSINWEIPYDHILRRSTNDMQEATEHGAECLSILYALQNTDFTVLSRSRKGSGFDYWLTTKNAVLFQGSARLEVSGILEGKDKVAERMRSKQEQTKKSDKSSLPAFVSVVEFSRPLIAFKKR